MGAAVADSRDITQEVTRGAGPFRVVIDTDLVLSAQVFAQGRLTPLRQAWQGRRVQPLVSRVTAAELICVLAYPKFKLSAVEQEELPTDYLPYCRTVRIPGPPPTTPACRDPFDTPFPELAVAAKGHALITGDQNLLCPAGSIACPVMAPERFSGALCP